MDKKYVTTGKPAIGGAVWVGPVGSTLPTDATTAIDTSVFKDLGYCSKDGLKELGELTTEDIKSGAARSLIAMKPKKRISTSLL